MVNILWSLFAFLIAIGILVTFHEFGHFIVARKLGVKVLRFSIGFGKVLWSRTDKAGTEYAISAIPLGGYVKMLDETEGEVAPEELKFAFNRKPLWIRTSVVVAGPLFNLIFALFAYWLMFVIGVSHIAPILGPVPSQSIAAKAGLQRGDEIVAIGQDKTTSWQEVNLKLFPHIGEKKNLVISAIPTTAKQSRLYTLDLTHWTLNLKKPNLLKSLGLIPYVPPIPSIVGGISPDGPAAKAGLHVGDKVISIGETKVNNWDQLRDALKPYAEKRVIVTLNRKGVEIQRPITPERAGPLSEESNVIIGITSQPLKIPSNLRRKIRYSVLDAWKPAFQKTGQMISLTGTMLYKMVTGRVSLRALSGPVGIAEGAGRSAQLGISYYLSFLSLISISLGILNLLPIPVLDGGHLLYYLIEAIRRKPLKLETQAKGMQIGLILLLGLMLFAIMNDLLRVFS